MSNQGELLVTMPGNLPLPIEVLDSRLAPIVTMLPGQQRSLDAGLYAVRACLPDGTIFRQAVRITRRLRVEVRLPVHAGEGDPSRRTRQWWLDYAAYAQPNAYATRPAARVREVRAQPAGRIRTRIDFEDKADGFLFLDPGIGRTDRTMIRLPPVGGAVEVFADLRSVRARGLSVESVAATAAIRLADAGHRRTAWQMLGLSEPHERSPLVTCILGFLQLRFGSGQPLPTGAVYKRAPDLPDAWVLEGQIRRQAGRETSAVEAFLTALSLGVPILSDAVSSLISGLRQEVPATLERWDRFSARRLDGLARLAAEADLARTVFTVTAAETVLLDALNAIAPAGSRVLRPTESRVPFRVQDVTSLIRPDAVPWRPAGATGAVLVSATQRLSSRSIRRRMGGKAPNPIVVGRASEEGAPAIITSATERVEWAFDSLVRELQETFRGKGRAEQRKRRVGEHKEEPAALRNKRLRVEWRAKGYGPWPRRAEEHKEEPAEEWQPPPTVGA